ncbi:unnamed protein product [Timema podura]|uniref:Uncharacterized protein n=1 Tax=Timema podura TaxID=61482 RepID=A0ABN7P582_TIMPD|nr:unnamed protein product [Timema podura]
MIRTTTRNTVARTCGRPLNYMCSPYEVTVDCAVRSIPPNPAFHLLPPPSLFRQTTENMDPNGPEAE